MRFLFIAKQKKNVDTFEATIAELTRRGHDVTLAIQQRDAERDRKLAERLAGPRFALVSCPEERGDAWRKVAPLVRSVRDWAHYYQPSYARAAKLHQRALTRLLRELGAAATLDVSALGLDSTAGTRLRDALAHVEAGIPSDPLHEEFISRHAPDVVIVTPGLHFGSGQSDFIKSARARGIPAWMLLFSWDNLSTKGALHVAPDRLFVWNARQVREAEELHAYPRDLVTIAGAPRFDDFFALASVVPRDAFFLPLGLDPRQRSILYLCSSKFIAADEVSFIRSWLSTVRSSRSRAVREANVVIRPHPDVPLEPREGQARAVTWTGMSQATGWVHHPFEDQGAVVLRTTYSTPQAFYECLHHADTVVALNTSAELEAGIVGRPVLTVLASGEAADGQAHTLHFDYLLQEHGGFVRYAPDLTTHERHLADVLDGAPAVDSIRAFVMAFLRPHGNRPVASLLAEMLTDANVSGSDAREGARDAVVPRAHPSVDLAGTEPADALATKSLVIDGVSGLSMLATPETRRFRQQGTLRLDPAVVAWLEEVVAPGDVLYDIGAGIGTYALVAAITRGALAVAFEPGFAVYRTLCENIRRNDAGHSVIPLPIALTDRPGFFELEFSGTSGGPHHVLRNREWRQRRETVEGRQGHPVCAERLDAVVGRYRIPVPHAVRVNATREADRILTGGAGVFREGTVKSLLVTVSRPDDMKAVVVAAQSAGFTGGHLTGSEDAGFSARFDRTARPDTGVWNRLRSATKRRPTPSP